MDEMAVGKTSIAKAIRQLVGKDSKQPEEDGNLPFTITSDAVIPEDKETSVFIFDEELNESDEITEVVTLRYTPSASEDSFDSNAPIYDLMGRRLRQKPASGYYIQGGKKFFVK